MFFFIFAHFSHVHRCHNFANKIRRHDLTPFFKSPGSVDFLQKFSVFPDIFFMPNKHHEVFQKSRFSSKNTKIRRNSRNLKKLFYFFENSIFAGQKKQNFHFFQDFFCFFLKILLKKNLKFFHVFCRFLNKRSNKLSLRHKHFYRSLKGSYNKRKCKKKVLKF